MINIFRKLVSDKALTFTMTPKKGFFGIGKSKATSHVQKKFIPI